ncbi:MAG: alpha/beta fold hydrolase BchO [Hyphomicrobiales bacterium]
MMRPRLDFEREGRAWPHREASRFVDAAGFRWHVQTMGDGPSLVLLHGTGASTHSFAQLAPRLAQRFRVIMPDLPGHAFSHDGGPDTLSTAGMAKAVAALLQALGESPPVVLGHSAGAAIAIRATLDGLVQPKLIVSLNGALLALRGVAGHLFAPMAKLMSFNWFMPWIFASRAADESVIDRLLQGTGSTVGADARTCYATLARSPQHVSAAFGMMANWDLPGLERDLPKLRTKLLLVAGERDHMIPPEQATHAAQLVKDADVMTLPSVGHLLHEEAPDLVAGIIVRAAEDAGALPKSEEPGR